MEISPVKICGKCIEELTSESHINKGTAELSWKWAPPESDCSLEIKSGSILSMYLTLDGNSHRSFVKLWQMKFNFKK